MKITTKEEVHTMNKKFLVSATTAALVASAVVPAASAANFKDIETAVDHKAAILALADMKIISGYPDGTFKPNATVTRGNVVKFLGKWLVQRGYKIPEDALTKQRFDDVPLGLPDKELVQYAALVKDAKVFEGSNNKLNYNGLMNRQNMALVLTRAVTQVYGISLTDLYKERGFKSEITDIKHLEAYQSEAIIALEAVGITKVKQYNPAGTVKRGQFASFLNRTIEEIPKISQKEDKIASVKVVSAQELSVTFESKRVVAVELLSPLPVNKEQEITIYIDKKPYTVKVKYEKPNLAIVKQEAINGGQYAVTFNEPLAAKSADQVKASFKELAFNTPNNVRTVTLSEDKKTLIFTMERYLLGQYEVTLENVQNEAGEVLPKNTKKENFAADTHAPRIVEAAYKNHKVTRIYFSEPMKNLVDGELSARNSANKAVQGITYKLSEDGLYADADLTHAHVNNVWVEPEEQITIYSSMKDLAGNLTDEDFKRISVKKGKKDGTPPYVIGAKQAGPRLIEVTFSEPILTPDQDSFVVKKRNETYDVQTITLKEDSESTYVITLKSHAEGDLVITPKSGYVVRDLSGERLETFSVGATMTIDRTVPSIVKKEVLFKEGREYYAITYDRDIALKPIIDSETNRESTIPFVRYSGSFIDSSSLTHNIVNSSRAYLQKEGTRQVLISLADLFNGHDHEGLTYKGTFSVSGISSLYEVEAPKTAIDFTLTRGKDTAQSTIKVKLDSVTVKDNDTVLVKFNRPIDAASARNTANYTLVDSDAVIESVDVLAEAPDTAIVKLKQNSNSKSGNVTVRVSGVKAKGSAVEMDTTAREVLLNENMRPYLVNAEFTDKALTLTFSEALTVPENSFIIPNNMTASHAPGSDKVVIERKDKETIPTTITVKAEDVKDVKGNLLQLDQTFTKK